MKQETDTKLRDTLKQIQLRTQVGLGRTLTHSQLAKLARVGDRSLGDWMRGVSAPNGMGAILELLSQLPANDVSAVLEYWRSRSTARATGKKLNGTKPDILTASKSKTTKPQIAKKFQK